MIKYMVHNKCTERERDIFITSTPKEANRYILNIRKVTRADVIL